MEMWITAVLLLTSRARRIPPASGCEQGNHSQLPQAPHPGEGVGLDGADGIVPEVPAGTNTGSVNTRHALAGTELLHIDFTNDSSSR